MLYIIMYEHVHCQRGLSPLQTLFLLQAGFLGLVAASLIARTYCDVWMISNGTAIEA